MSRDTYTTHRLFTRMWRDYLRSYWPHMVMALLLMVIEGSTLGLLSWMFKPLFDMVLVGGTTAAAWWVGGVIFSLFVIRAVTLIINRSLMTSVSLSVSSCMQTDLLRHILNLDTRFFQQNPTGALIERVQGDTAAVQGVWAAFISGMGRDVISLVALLVAAISIDVYWTLLALIGAPLLILPIILAQRYVRRKMKQIRGRSSDRATHLDEVLHGMQAVRLNQMENYQLGRFAAIVDHIRDGGIKMAAISAVIPALIDIVTGIGFVGVLALGGAEVTRGERTVGDFMAFFSAIALAFQPMRRLGMLAGTFQIAAASLERIYGIFDIRPTVFSGPREVAPDDTTIRLRDVWLSFDDTPILRGLNLTAQAGQTTALVGPSGAGKTTIFNLLSRMIDPDQGEVTLGGVAVRDFDLVTLRRQFSTVMQNPALFDETLRDNIEAGHETDPDVLHRAVVAAHVADFSDQLPCGLDSPAGPRGTALSGGQRQRVAIARAVLRDAPVLLLDEATSALDAASERMVQQALDDLSRERTTLVIAHRLSTVRNADKIVVIESGQAVEEGTHDELMARQGAYARLVKLQFRSNDD